MTATEQDKQDLQTLTALVASGVLRGEKIKAVLASWDSANVTATPLPSCKDAILKYRDAGKALGCSVPNVKRLVYAGLLTPVIMPGGYRASGVSVASVNALMASATASNRYAKKIA